MKKIIYLLMAAMAIFAVSCNKDKNGEQKEEGGDVPAPQFRIKSLSYCDGDNLATAEAAGWADKWAYTYDEQGRVIDVDRHDGDDKHWVFTYGDDNTVTINRQDNKEKYVLTLNDKGVCTSILDDVLESEWGAYKETAVFEYDATLRVTKIQKEGQLRSELSWRDNCLVSWTKTQDENHKRVFTYSTEKNLGDLHEIYSEAIDPPARWLYETGMFGHGPANLVLTSVWEHDPENLSNITHEKDENGYVVSEKKVFPGGWTEFFVIEWEPIPAAE